MLSKATGNTILDDGYGFFCDIENNDVPVQDMPIPNMDMPSQIVMPMSSQIVMPMSSQIVMPMSSQIVMPMSSQIVMPMSSQIVMPMSQMPIPLPLPMAISSTPINPRKRLRPMSNLFQRTIYSGIVMYAFSVAIYVCLFMPIDF
jgi:hypothetical protein